MSIELRDGLSPEDSLSRTIEIMRSEATYERGQSDLLASEGQDLSVDISDAATHLRLSRVYTDATKDLTTFLQSLTRNIQRALHPDLKNTSDKEINTFSVLQEESEKEMERYYEEILRNLRAH